MNKDKSIFKFTLTRFQALFIKYLRVRGNCSWRALSSHFEFRYNLQTGERTTNYDYTDNNGSMFVKILGNQIIGMLLHEEAEKVLNEKFDIDE